MSSLQERIAFHGVLLSVITKDGTRCLANFFQESMPSVRDGEVTGKSGRRKLLKDFVQESKLLGKRDGLPEWDNEELEFFSKSALACLRVDELQFETLYKLIVSFCETPKGDVRPSWWEKKKTLDTSPHCDIIRLQRAYIELYDAPSTRMTLEKFDEQWLTLVEVFRRMVTSIHRARYKSIYDRCIALKDMTGYFQLLHDIEESFDSLESVRWSDEEKETDDDDPEGEVLQVMSDDMVDGIVTSSIKVDPAHMFYPQDATNPALPRLGRLHRIGSIGAGGFGKVRLYKDTHSGLLVAVKKDVSKHSKSRRKALLNEISLMRRLIHKRIVMYYGAVEARSKVYLLMEYMPQGSLHDKLKRSGPLEEPTVKKYTYEILEGLIYLHSQQIIHRDIKGSNVLLTEEDEGIKLTDFGLSWQLKGSSDRTKGRAGTLYYMAPEVLRGMAYGTKADIWSLGCTIVEMLTTRPPWANAGLDSADLAFRIANNPPDYHLSQGIASAKLRKLLYMMFIPKPHYRPTAVLLMEEEVFKED